MQPARSPVGALDDAGRKDGFCLIGPYNPQSGGHLGAWFRLFFWAAIAVAVAVFPLSFHADWFDLEDLDDESLHQTLAEGLADLEGACREWRWTDALKVLIVTDSLLLFSLLFRMKALRSFEHLLPELLQQWELQAQTRAEQKAQRRKQKAEQKALRELEQLLADDHASHRRADHDRR